MKGEIVKKYYDYVKQKVIVVVELITKDDDTIKENEIVVIEKHKEKRSTSQNRYAWELIGKIADKLRLSKEEVYFKMLKNYGQSEIVSVSSNVDTVGYFKYYEKVGKGYVNDKEFIHYKIYKGSSEFNTQEMSVFIDGIIQECNDIGIPTLTTEQVRAMRLI